jgi:hypothetical protein
MDYAQEERNDFKRQLVELGKIIGDGIAYFSTWRGLMVEDEVSAHALNRYRGLFLPARGALLWTTLMQFAKVFDRNPKTISLRNLLAAAKKDRERLTPYITNENLQHIEQKIEESKDLLNRLKRFRDKRLAHHDADVKDDMSLLYGEVKKLVEEVKSMYNSLTKGYDRSVTSFDFLAREAERHTSQVVSIMCEERDRAIRTSKKMRTAT